MPKKEPPPPDLPTRTTGIINGWFYENGKPIKTVLAVAKHAVEADRPGRGKARRGGRSKAPCLESS